MEHYIFTYLIIAVTVLISFYAFQNEEMGDRMLFSTYAILRENEYHRLITSAFIHANMGHLIFNMFSLYSFALTLERGYGIRIITLIYLASMVGGGLLSLMINRKNMNYRALGASGAVCGIIFSSIFLVPGGSIYIFPLPLPIPAWAFGILFVLASMYGIGKQAGNIGHDAHLGGALTGVLMAGLIRPQSILQNPILASAIVIPAVLFLIFHKREQ